MRISKGQLRKQATKMGMLGSHTTTTKNLPNVNSQPMLTGSIYGKQTPQPSKIAKKQTRIGGKKGGGRITFNSQAKRIVDKSARLPKTKSTL